MSALWKAAITRVLHKAMRPHGPVTHTNFAWNRGNGVSPPCKRNVLLAFVLYKTEHLRLIGSRPIESVQF